MNQADYENEYLKCAANPTYFLNAYGYVFDAKKQSVSKMTCFKYQEECLYAYHKNRNNIVLKSRQCLPEGTNVDTPSGTIVIQDLKIGDELYSFNLNKNKLEIDYIKDSWCSGNKQCVNVITYDGKKIEVGENHPFYIIDKGWVSAKNLINGDKILNRKSKYSIVKKIAVTGEKRCYDISVEKNENFFVDDLLVHNTGLSVITAGYVAWRLIFRKDEKILIIANDGAGAIRFLSTVKQFIDYTPKWLLPKDGTYLVNNQREVKLQNKSQAIAKASSPEAGRGDSLTLLVLDETAFIENADTIWMAAGMALSATQGKCIMLSCVPEDTYVFTNNGLTQIKNFINKEKIGGYNVDKYKILGKDGLRQGQLLFNNGFHKTKKITTTNSFLEGTLNHKIWACKNGNFNWFKIEELQVGDYISIQYGNELWGNNDKIIDFNCQDSDKCLNKFNPKIITKEIAYFLGLFLAKGSAYKSYNSKGEFIDGNVSLTCEDDISKAIIDIGMKYYIDKDGSHYNIECKQLILFLEHLGFDLKKHAKNKAIPQRLLEMSRENIIYLLKGIFDVDGYSIKDKGCVGISLNSKEMINQIRMLLLNFGILTEYCEAWVKPTKEVDKSTLKFKISCNGKNSKIFYEKINFNFKRKQLNECILDKYNFIRSDINDIVPFSSDLLKKICTESGHNITWFKERNCFLNNLINSKGGKNKNVSRNVFLRVFKIIKENLSTETILEVEKILKDNLKWNKVNTVEYSEKNTYDFSLPNNKKDFWCHSVLYNGILGHQTPNGTGNLYNSMWAEADKKQNNFDKDDFVPIRVHWTQNPFSSEGLELRINEEGEKEYWSPWYEGECKRMQYDKVKIAQELDLSFEGSKYLAIENELINKYDKRLLLEEYKLIDKNKIFYDYKNKPGERFVKYETNFIVYKKYIEGHKYIFGCLPPDEMVLTNNGLKQIKNISFDDKLVDENGNYINIINKQMYDVVNEDTFEIKVDNTYRTTKFTKEHPILVSQNTKLKRAYNSVLKKEGKRYWDFDFNYTKAESVKVGNWIKVPNIYKKELSTDINEKWCFGNKVRNDFIIPSPIDKKDFWWFIGMWLGDGWINKYNNSYSISLCFNKSEFFYIKKIESIISSLFNRTISITEKDSVFEIVFNSKELYYFILENFGQYSYGKKISEWVKYIPKQYKLELIKGYFDSDGCWIKSIKNSRKNSKISFVSINLELLESFQDILFSVGLISGLRKLRKAKMQTIKGREVSSKQCYDLCLFNFDSLKLVELLNDKIDIKLNKFDASEFYNKNKRIVSSCHFSDDEDFIYFKIKDIKKTKFTGKVYNFECDTHTFMCHHITTHNCDVARGDGSDFSTIQIIDIDELEVVAEYRDKVAPDLFAHVIYNAGMDYGTAYLVVECNNHGLATAIDLSRKMNYPRMFYSKAITEIYARPYDYKISEDEIIPGFQTTKKTRPLLINNLRIHLRDGSLKIYSKNLMSEFRTFVQIKDKAQAEKGKHDDLIMALGIGLFIRDTEYKNATETKELYKEMIDSIGFVSKTINGQNYSSNPVSENISDIPPEAGGIFFNNFSKKNNDDSEDFNDINWLLN